jgi:hypothetical protein
MVGKYTAKEPHSILKNPDGSPKMKDIIHIPKLDKYNESGEHGELKITYWQYKVPVIQAVSATVQQFTHWIKTGYYNPDVDIILTPYNISYGTIEINKGIQQYLGIQRGAVVHEIIAGYEKHYLAEGDRVLYDKEDAIIVKIARNVGYLGKAPAPPSVYLDRWGVLQRQLSEEEERAYEQEESALGSAALDKFFEAFEDGEKDERVNSASHAITIRFSYTDEEVTLSTSSEINNLLGGNAVTIYKMQGSECGSVFLMLHHSQSAHINNELLYTGITRARNKLHVLCEMDTFFKGVKTHKVRGVTLKDKIEFFKGKIEFKEMEAELAFLQQQRESKRLRLEQEKLRKQTLREQKEREQELEQGIPDNDDNPGDEHSSEYLLDYTDLCPHSSSSMFDDTLDTLQEMDIQDSNQSQPQEVQSPQPTQEQSREQLLVSPKTNALIERLRKLKEARQMG